MEALTRVGVLVQSSAVEVRQAVDVGREVSRHPVEDHAQSRPVAGVPETREPLRRPKARGRRKLAQRLVAPGARERVLHDRQKLYVGEAQVGGVGYEPLGQGVPVQHAGRVALRPQPRGDVNLVDAYRRVHRLPRLAFRHPGAVGPGVLQGGGDDGGGGRRQLGRARQRIGALRHAPVGADHLVLVAHARCEPRYEQLPHPRLVAQAHRMAAAVPGVEVADYRDAARVRRPDGEGHALHPVQAGRLRAEPLGQLPVRALRKKVEVEFAEHQAEAVGVFGLLHRATPADPQPVGDRLGEATGEEAGFADRLQIGEVTPVAAGESFHALCAGLESAHHPALRRVVRTEEAEGIGQPSFQELRRGGQGRIVGAH